MRGYVDEEASLRGINGVSRATSFGSNGINHLLVSQDRVASKWVFENPRRRQVHLPSKHCLKLLNHVHPVPSPMRLVRMKTDHYIDIALRPEVIAHDGAEQSKMGESPLL